MACVDLAGADEQKWKKWLQKRVFIEEMLGSH